MIGIYKITNQLNDKCYIGQSIDIKTRWIQHLYCGKNNFQKGKLYPAMFKTSYAPLSQWQRKVPQKHCSFGSNPKWSTKYPSSRTAYALR